MKNFQLKNHDWWNIENEHRKKRRGRSKRPVCWRSPEAGQRDDGLVEPPGGNKVIPDWVGGVVPPGRLETKSWSPAAPTAAAFHTDCDSPG